MVAQQTQVPTSCPHCQGKDVGDLPTTPDGRPITRVIWQGLVPHPSGQGMVPLINLDLGAGQLPNRVEFPQVARWQASVSYCPHCATQFYCGPDWRALVEDAEGPGLVVP